MTRHPIDHPRDDTPPDAAARYRRIAVKASADKPHPATIAATRKPRAAAGERLRRYLRIERGREA